MFNNIYFYSGYNYVMLYSFEKERIKYIQPKSNSNWDSVIISSEFNVSFDNINSKDNKKKRKLEHTIDNINNNAIIDFAKYMHKYAFEYTPITRLSDYLNNTFFIENTNIIYELFYKIQKTYHILKRFFRRITLHKIKKYNNEFDLSLGKLENIKPHLKINIIEEHILYEFRLSDLINIININLSNCDDNFFPNVQSIKNPYTNNHISKHNLYNIYFSISQSAYITPILFTHLFLCDFNYKLFEKRNDIEIRELGIHTYWNNITLIDSRLYINTIIRLCKYIKPSFKIAISFPISILFNTFRYFIKH